MDYSLSFLGGVLSCLAPCCLAGIPLIIGYIGVQREPSLKKAALLSFCFMVGLILTFTILGLIAVSFGTIFGAVAGPFWRYLLAVFIIAMGLSLLDLLPFNLGSYAPKMPRLKGIPGALVVGILYGLVASPCTTPILAGILAYASLQDNLVHGILLLASYGLGHGIILLGLGVSAGLAGTAAKLRSFSGYFQKGSGVLLILAGIYLILYV